MIARGGSRYRIHAGAAAVLAGVLALIVTGCTHATAELASVDSPAGSTSAVPVSSTTTASTAQPNPTATPDQRPSVPPAGACPQSGLVVAVWMPDAAMGLRVVALRAVNCGTVTRTLKGYPGIRLLGQDARTVLAVAIRRGVIAGGLRNPAVASIVLKPGQGATTVLSWRNLTTQDNPVTAAYVRITAVRGAPPQDLPLTVDLGNTGRIAVTAWERAGP